MIGNRSRATILNTHWVEFLEWLMSQKCHTFGMQTLWTTEDLDNPDPDRVDNHTEWIGAPTEQNFWVWYMLHKIKRGKSK